MDNFYVSREKMNISVEKMSERDFTIFRVLRTWLNLVKYFLLEMLFGIHLLIGLQNVCWQIVAIIQYQNKQVAQNITIKISLWETSISYSKLHKVHIYHRNVILKDYINNTSDYRYWNQLIRYLIQTSKSLPAQPETWNKWRKISRSLTWINISLPLTPPPLRRKQLPHLSIPQLPCNRVSLPLR